MKNVSVKILFLTVALVGLSACGGVSSVEVSEKSRLLNEEAQARSNALAIREAALARRALALETLETQLAGTNDAAAPIAENSAGALNFPALNTGECIAPLFSPANFAHGPTEYLTSESYDMLSTVAEQFETREQLILVGRKAVNPTFEVEYETRIQTITVRPEYETIRVIPAEFEHIPITAETRPAHLAWQPCNADESSFCATEVEAETFQLERKIVRRSAFVQTETVPAATIQIAYSAPLNNAANANLVLTDIYEPVQFAVLVKPASVVNEVVPAKSTLLDTSSLITPARMVLRPVLCADKLHGDSGRALAEQIRDALLNKKYSVEASGPFNAELLKALHEFQADNGLALSSDAPSLETLQALGLSF